MIQLSREYTKSLAELVSRYRYDIFFDNLDEQLNLPKYRENGNVKRIGKSWLKNAARTSRFQDNQEWRFLSHNLVVFNVLNFFVYLVFT